jgi:hypothetical protein
MLKLKDKTDKYYINKPTIFNIPFKLIICGKSQLSGKTTVLANLLLRKKFYKDDFNGENIFIVSPSIRNDNKLKIIIRQLHIPRSNLIDTYDEQLLTEIYSMIEEEYESAVEDERTPENYLFVFDDMSFSGVLKGRNGAKVHGVINKMFCNGRHIMLSTILTTQSYVDISTACRENATGMILFSCSNRQLDQIADDHSFIKRQDFKRIFRETTKKKHSFLVVNYSNDADMRYLDSNFKQVAHKRT